MERLCGKVVAQKKFVIFETEKNKQTKKRTNKTPPKQGRKH